MSHQVEKLYCRRMGKKILEKGFSLENLSTMNNLLIFTESALGPLRSSSLDVHVFIYLFVAFN